MKHFWLDADQQALMDTATSTAADYTHIAAVKLGKSWKRELKGQAGFKVAEADYLRTFNVTRTGKSNYHKVPDLDSFVRLTPAQATLMKLRYAGTDDGFVMPDPTGEFWGNMLIAQHDQKTRNFMSGFRNSAFACLMMFTQGNGFGPTVATVANHCAGLPVSWAARLVWNEGHRWHVAHIPVGGKTHPVPDAYRDAFNDLFDVSTTTCGQLWARQWWEFCQSAANRQRHYIRDISNEPIL